MNDFVNHQIAHNVIFVSVESDLGNFVFDKLKEKYPGKVLIYPSVEIYHQYWCDDMIVIQKLISEAPMGIMENGIPFRMTLPKEPYSADRGYRAMVEIGEASEKNGVSEMTQDEINAEIEASRRERQVVDK